MPGITMTLRIGNRRRPEIVPRQFIEALQNMEITTSDSNRSGFQLVFQIGRSGNRDLQDDPLLKSNILIPFNRVIIVMTIQARATVLMDGMITHQQFSPSADPGRATLTLTGEDVSVMMDQAQGKQEPRPQQNERTIVYSILSSAAYRNYGFIPDIQRTPTNITPTKNERIPAQSGSDLAYIQDLGKRFDYVFFVTPGPGIGQNIAYWGPRPRGGLPQPAITVNMGPFTNAESVNLSFDAQAATKVEGRAQDRKTNQIRPVPAAVNSLPTLAKQSGLQLQTQQKVQRVQTYTETGHELAQAQALTQAMVNRSSESTLVVKGELDTLRYGHILKLRELVAVRGIGQTHDGLYYVKSVTHRIRKGQYQQQFTVTREGRGSTISRVAQ